MTFVLRNNKLLIIIAFALNFIAFASIFTRSTDIDEGIIAAHSYYLNEDGFVRSPHFHNADFNWENRQYHYHKLTVWMGSLVTKVFGFHLVVFRLISYLFYLLFIFVLYKVIQLKKLSIETFWLFQIIFLINSTVFKFAFIYRPEVVVMSLGFLSYYLLLKYKESSKAYFFIGSAIAAGCAALMHLNGLVFIAAGGFLLLIRREFFKSIAYGIIGGLTTLFYFADTLSTSKFAGWKEQFFADPNLIGKKASPFLKILDEHMRFFHSEREIIFSVLLLVAFIFSYRTIKKVVPGMVWYFSILAISLAFISHGATTKYMLIYMPYMTFFVSITLLEFNKHHRIQKIILSLFLAAFVGYHGYVNGKILSKSYNVVKRHAELAERIPQKNTLIFANEGFVFNQISNFEIQSPCAFNFHYSTFHPRESTTVNDFFTFLDEGNTQFVLIDRKIEISHPYNKVPQENLKKGDTYFNYTVIDKGDDFILFSQNSPNQESVK